MKKITLSFLLLFSVITSFIYVNGFFITSGNTAVAQNNNGNQPPAVSETKLIDSLIQKGNDFKNPPAINPQSTASKNERLAVNQSKATVSKKDTIPAPEKKQSSIPKDSVQTFTAEEVAMHNTRKDCYCIVKGNVYDVSSYIAKHPGGSRTIVSRCGKEITGIFAEIHSNRAWDLLSKYKIGILKK